MNSTSSLQLCRHFFYLLTPPRFGVLNRESESSGSQSVYRNLFPRGPHSSRNNFFGIKQGGAHDLAKFRVPMIHRFMTSHPVAELLLCFRAKHKDGRPMLFGFLVIFTHRLMELCILNAENIKKVYSRPFKQMS